MPVKENVDNNNIKAELTEESDYYQLVFHRNWIRKKHTRCISSSSSLFASHIRNLARKEEVNFLLLTHSYHFTAVRYMPPLNDYFPFFYGLLRSICSPFEYLFYYRFIN